MAREGGDSGMAMTQRAIFQRDPAAISPLRMFDNVTPFGSQRFLFAAIAAFAERGYHASTTREIALLAGSSPAGMYTYYRTKSDLLYEVSLIVHLHVLPVMREGIYSGSDPATRMMGLVKALVSFHSVEHIVVGMVTSNFRALEKERVDEILKLRREAKFMVLTEVAAGVAAGDFTVSSAEGAALAILRLTDVTSWYNELGPMSPTKLGEVFSDLILRMLGVDTD